jgi:hypothetical protein
MMTTHAAGKIRTSIKTVIAVGDSRCTSGVSDARDLDENARLVNDLATRWERRRQPRRFHSIHRVSRWARYWLGRRLCVLRLRQ